MNRFRTTHWSLVLAAGGASGDSARALGELCRIYRPPVLAFLRGRGHGAAEAEDLTQAFFEQFLRLRSHAAADPARGSFRAFLLGSLRNFLANQHAAATAWKRGGGLAPLPLDEVFDAPADADTPEAAFERAFAHEVLHQAMNRLLAEAQASGKAEQLATLRPFLLASPGPDEYARAAEALGWRRNTLAVSIHRLRQRLHDLVREEVCDTVSDAAELESELQRMHAVLDKDAPS